MHVQCNKWLHKLIEFRSKTCLFAFLFPNSHNAFVSATSHTVLQWRNQWRLQFWKLPPAQVNFTVRTQLLWYGPISKLPFQNCVPLHCKVVSGMEFSSRVEQPRVMVPRHWHFPSVFGDRMTELRVPWVVLAKVSQILGPSAGVDVEYWKIKLNAAIGSLNPYDFGWNCIFSCNQRLFLGWGWVAGRRLKYPQVPVRFTGDAEGRLCRLCHSIFFTRICFAICASVSLVFVVVEQQRIEKNWRQY